MNQVHFRTAVTTDVDAIVALVESAYRGDVSRAGWTTEADLLDGQRTDSAGVAALIAGNAGRVLLAEPAVTGSGPDSAAGQAQAGALLACCHIEHDNAQCCHFGMFAVRPAEQRAGLGRMLLGEAERIACAEWNCALMTMTVIDVRAELIAWYERRGYRRTGRFRPFPYGDARFGLPRRGDLRFEVLEKPLRREMRE